ncbi:class I SAM-dependent methyltransferase [Patescibacteria group bacterium]
MKNVDQKSNQIREKVKTFYSEAAESFSDSRNTWWEDLAFINQYVKEGTTVLDFGCGNGRLITFLDISPDYYRGIDISRELLQIAKHRYPRYFFTQIERENETKFSDERFDVVMSIAALHHMNPEMAAGALSEIKRIVKPGGKVIISVWYMWKPKWIKRLLASWARGRFEMSADIPFEGKSETFMRYCYWWKQEQLEATIKAAGLEVLEARTTTGLNQEKRNIVVVAENPLTEKSSAPIQSERIPSRRPDHKKRRTVRV